MPASYCLDVWSLSLVKLIPRQTIFPSTDCTQSLSSPYPRPFLMTRGEDRKVIIYDVALNVTWDSPGSCRLPVEKLTKWEKHFLLPPRVFVHHLQGTNELRLLSSFSELISVPEQKTGIESLQLIVCCCLEKSANCILFEVTIHQNWSWYLVHQPTVPDLDLAGLHWINSSPPSTPCRLVIIAGYSSHFSSHLPRPRSHSAHITEIHFDFPPRHHSPSHVTAATRKTDNNIVDQTDLITRTRQLLFWAEPGLYWWLFASFNSVSGDCIPSLAANDRAEWV